MQTHEEMMKFIAQKETAERERIQSSARDVHRWCVSLRGWDQYSIDLPLDMCGKSLYTTSTDVIGGMKEVSSDTDWIMREVSKATGRAWNIIRAVDGEDESYRTIAELEDSNIRIMRSYSVTNESPTEYNGWSSYASWAVALYIDNHQRAYHTVTMRAGFVVQDRVSEQPAADFANWLSNTWYTLFGVGMRNGLQDDIKNAGETMSDINWWEVVAHYLEV